MDKISLDPNFPSVGHALRVIKIYVSPILRVDVIDVLRQRMFVVFPIDATYAVRRVHIKVTP